MTPVSVSFIGVTAIMSRSRKVKKQTCVDCGKYLKKSRKFFMYGIVKGRKRCIPCVIDNVMDIFEVDDIL